MSGFPAGEVPQTSFTVRSFNFFCPDPEDSRSKESARGRAGSQVRGVAQKARRFLRMGIPVGNEIPESRAGGTPPPALARSCESGTWGGWSRSWPSRSDRRPAVGCAGLTAGQDCSSARRAAEAGERPRCRPARW